MRSSSSRRRIAAAAGTVAGAMVLTIAMPAQAAAPTWKTSGYQPKCDLSVLTSISPEAYAYYDNTSPVIRGVNASRVLRIKNTGTSVTLFSIHATDACSGVAGVTTYVLHDGAPLPFTQAVEPSDGNYFDTTMKIGGEATMGDLGKYTLPTVMVSDRFASFVLDGASKNLLDSTARSGGSDYTGIAATADYRNLASYLLRDSKLTVAKNKSKIKKGKSVTVSGKLTYANGTTYAGLAGQKVSLQRKTVGAKSWTTVGSATTNASGAVSVSTKPKKSAYFRLVYAGKFAAPWYAPFTTGSTAKVTVKTKKK